MSQIYVSNYRAMLLKVIGHYGFAEDSLLIENIMEFCNQPGSPIPDFNEHRPAKCLMDRKDNPYFLINDVLTKEMHSTALDTLAFSGYSNDEIQFLETVESFLVYLLLHEISHYVLRDVQKEMNQLQAEKSSNNYAMAEFHRLTETGVIENHHSESK